MEKFILVLLLGPGGFKYRWTKKYNKYLENSFQKYGKENFLFEIVCLCKPEECLKYEQYYLDHYEPFWWTDKGYNLCENAGNTLGTKRTEETKNQQRQLKEKKMKRVERIDPKTRRNKRI